MSDLSTWRADVERILSWTQRDERFLDRIGARLSESQRTALRALIDARGDARAVVQRLGPLTVAKLRLAAVRAPERMRAPLAETLRVVERPLQPAWSPPPGATPEQIAERFLERFGERLEDATGRVSRASASARALARTLRTVAGSKELVEALDALHTQLAELRRAAETCAHPETDRAAWLEHVGSLVHEAVDTIEAVRGLRARAVELADRCEAVARALDDWAGAEPAERVSSSEAMSARVRAASEAVASMHDELAQLVLGR